MTITEWRKIHMGVDAETWHSRSGKRIELFTEDLLEALKKADIIRVEFICKDDIITAEIHFNFEEA